MNEKMLATRSFCVPVERETASKSRLIGMNLKVYESFKIVFSEIIFLLNIIYFWKPYTKELILKGMSGQPNAGASPLRSNNPVFEILADKLLILVKVIEFHFLELIFYTLQTLNVGGA